MTKITISDITKSKGKRKLVCTTAYTYSMAQIVSELSFDLLLIGDSVGMEMQGYPSTVSVTLDDILYHLKGVVRADTQCFIVADMPFLTAEISTEKTMENAGRLIQEGGADAVKIEGGKEKAETIARLTDAGIPVVGHIGLNPQKILKMGGYHIQGKTKEASALLLEDATALAKSGALALVLECVPSPVAAMITRETSIPTIGIGAGIDCDGQILVVNDIIGLHHHFKPKFVKQFGDVRSVIASALQQYQEEVRNGIFPDTEHSYE